MKSNITVILNGYKRGYNLKEQLDAINNQTVKPDEVLLWYNHPGDDELVNYDVVNEVPTALNNTNYGVWARFAFALNAKSKYICIFDDDTIPGKMWLENCLSTIKTHRGLLGTVGLLYTYPPEPTAYNDSYFSHYLRFGWPHPNKNTVEVDLVGHSWFFEKEWLSSFWRTIPDTNKFKTAGEDMHFSYSIQKYLNLKTYVPPHPHDNIEMWGSTRGSELGNKDSLWSAGVTEQKKLIHNYYKILRNLGWKLKNDK